jgi:hypothetical protein
MAEHGGAESARAREGSGCRARRARRPPAGRYPQTNRPRTFNAVPLGEGRGADLARPLLYLLAVSVGLVLLTRLRQRHQPAGRAFGFKAA